MFTRLTPNDQQFSLLNVTKDDDIVPDSNVYNVIDNDSKYYLPWEVKVVIDKLNICNELSVLHINVRSLLSKLDNLQVLLEVVNVKFDVIIVSATWETDLNDQLSVDIKTTPISGVMVKLEVGLPCL